MGVLYVCICNELFCFPPEDKPNWWDAETLPVNNSELEVRKVSLYSLVCSITPRNIILMVL